MGVFFGVATALGRAEEDFAVGDALAAEVAWEDRVVEPVGASELAAALDRSDPAGCDAVSGDAACEVLATVRSASIVPAADAFGCGAPVVELQEASTISNTPIRANTAATTADSRPGIRRRPGRGETCSGIALLRHVGGCSGAAAATDQWACWRFVDRSAPDW